MPYESAPGTQQPPKSNGRLVDDVNDIIRQSKDSNIKFSVDPEVEKAINENNQATLDKISPTILQRWRIQKDKQRALIDWKQKFDIAEAARIAAEARKPKIPGSDKAGDARYAASIKENIIEPHYKPLISLKTKSALYLDEMNKNLKNVTDGMKWQTYLRTIQQDESVIRPGESEMAMMFMPVKAKLEGFLNKYGKLESWMTDELGRDINKMFMAMDEIKTRETVLATNNEAKNAAILGKKNIFDQRLPNQVKTISQDWARTKLNSGVRQVQSVQEAQQKLSQGAFKNGDMFIFQGKPFIVQGIKYGDESTNFRRLNNGIIEPWRMGR
jgi:hypothetical protein